MNGTALLAEFRKNRSETAFSELVCHYTNLVYSVARRRLWDVSIAQEAAQLVFIRLAKAAPDLHSDAQLVAWLHRTTLHVAVDLWRSETRRHAREEHAAAMQESVENATWNETAPVLDEALNELAEADRQVILLRFFDNKTMRDLGSVLGISEDAAKMRVSRALERLRTQLAIRGVTCAAVALGAMLSEHSVKAAPASLVATLALLKVPASAGTGALNVLLSIAKTKLALGLAALLAVGAATIFLLRSTTNPFSRTDSRRNAPSAAIAKTNQPALSQAPDAAIEEENQPDPAKLVQAVIQARQRISSGTVEFDTWTQSVDGETNHVHLKVLFEGAKRRFDSVGVEFAYVGVGDVGESNSAKIKELKLNREAAVKAGLLESFEAHNVSVWDGSVMLQYCENNGRPEGATIRDAKNGSIYYLFDVRCLGLKPYFSVQESLDTSFLNPGTFKLVGKESVKSFPTWHVRRVSELAYDLWIDAAHPERVCKVAFNGDVVTSKYDESHPSDPIPIEIIAMNNRNGSLAFGRRFIRSNFQPDVPIDPVSWTLAGLNMAVGTPVVDERIHQRIGYWDGAGLSDNLPPKKMTNSTPPLDQSDMLTLLEDKPTSPEALGAATWIMLNTPDGPNVETAAETIQVYHFADPDLINLCQQLQRFRHRSSRKLLEKILAKNPNTEVQANACFTLATLLKAQADHGNDKQATADAEKYFDRAISQFGQFTVKGRTIADLATPELDELRHLIIGKPAPQTEGVDLNGQRINLSDYRGKIVVLVFWINNCVPEVKLLQELQDRNPGKLAVVGVYCGNDRALGKSIAEDSGITWPSFHDGRDGPISVAWNSYSWVSYNIVDAKGIIRHRDLWAGKLNQAINALVKE